MTKIKLRARCKRRLCTFVLHLGIGINNVGKQILVLVVEEVAHAHHRHDIADLTHDGSQMEGDGGLHVAGLVEVLVMLQGHTLGEELHLGAVEGLEGLPVLEQVIVLRGDGRDTGLDPFNHTRSGLHALRAVGERFQNLALEIRIQTGVYIDAMSPNAIPANDLIKLLLCV